MKQALAQAEQQEAQAAEAEAAAKGQEQNKQMPEVKAPTVSISFKDLPPAGKIQAAAKYGIQLTAEDVMRDDGDGADAETKAETVAEGAF